MAFKDTLHYCDWGIDVKELQDVLGVCNKTAYNKLQGRPFTEREIATLMNYYDVTYGQLMSMIEKARSHYAKYR